MHTSTPKNAGF